MSAKLFLYSSKEVVQREDRYVSLSLTVQYFEEILESLGSFTVFQSEDEVQVGFVVHLTLVGQTLLEHSDEAK